MGGPYWKNVLSYWCVQVPVVCTIGTRGTKLVFRLQGGESGGGGT